MKGGKSMESILRTVLTHRSGRVWTGADFQDFENGEFLHTEIIWSSQFPEYIMAYGACAHLVTDPDIIVIEFLGPNNPSCPIPDLFELFGS